MPQDASREPWMQFGGMYRTVNDLNQPWVPSPIAHTPRSLPWTRPLLASSSDRTGSSTASVTIPSAAQQDDHAHDPDGPSGVGAGMIRRRKIWGLLNRMRGSDGKPRSVSQPQPSTSLSSNSPPSREPTVAAMEDPVPLAEWKAYGYYACPSVNGVHDSAGPAPEPSSRNYSPTSPRSRMNVQDVFNSLRSPDGTSHPDLWIPIQHSALPPRPTRWKEPRPQEALPFPWECQLNPFLEHQLFGATSLWFDIGQDPSMLCYGTVETTIPISRADRAQPATYPFLTHMFINAIGDDPIHPFLWPFMVRNPKGIKCEDIYNAIYENFQHYVSNSEYDDWPEVRQVQCTKAYRARMDLMLGGARGGTRSPGYEEGIRRVDYLGDNIMFRGLEPNPNMDGWVMFVGRTW